MNSGHGAAFETRECVLKPVSLFYRRKRACGPPFLYQLGEANRHATNST
jgi:hypothetical protein